MPKKKHEPVKAPKGTTKGLFSGKYGTPNLEKKLEGLSEAIECVQVAAKKLDQSNLTREAVVLLIQHAAGAGKLTKAQINLVLDTMLELGTTYLKKTPLIGKFKEKLSEKLDTVEVSPGCFMSPEAAEKYKGKPLIQVFKDEVKVDPEHQKMSDEMVEAMNQGFMKKMQKKLDVKIFVPMTSKEFAKPFDVPEITHEIFPGVHMSPEGAAKFKAGLPGGKVTVHELGKALKMAEQIKQVHLGTKEALKHKIGENLGSYFVKTLTPEELDMLHEHGFPGTLPISPLQVSFSGKGEVKEDGVIDLKGGPLTATMIQEAAEEGAKLGGKAPVVVGPIHPAIAKELPPEVKKALGIKTVDEDLQKPVKKKKLAKKKGQK